MSYTVTMLYTISIQILITKIIVFHSYFSWFQICTSMLHFVNAVAIAIHIQTMSYMCHPLKFYLLLQYKAKMLLHLRCCKYFNIIQAETLLFIYFLFFFCFKLKESGCINDCFCLWRFCYVFGVV